MHPLGHRFETVDRLGCLDLRHAMKPPCSRGAGQHEVRVHQIRPRAHADRFAFLFEIDPDRETTSQTGLQQTNHAVVLELLPNRS